MIALTFVLTVEDPGHFEKSRDVGSYVGLRPKRSESDESQPQLAISNEGDIYLRKLLVQGAHHIVGRRADRIRICSVGDEVGRTGGKNAKKRAIVPVAHKLVIPLHRLWVTGEACEPLRNSESRQRVKKSAA